MLSCCSAGTGKPLGEKKATKEEATAPDAADKTGAGPAPDVDCDNEEGGMCLGGDTKRGESFYAWRHGWRGGRGGGGGRATRALGGDACFSRPITLNTIR